MLEHENGNMSINSNKFSKLTPLGLITLGLTILFYSFARVGNFELNSLILAIGLTYGGIALLIACLMEFKKGNNFGSVFFGFYALFWISFVLITLIQKLDFVGPTVNGFILLYTINGILGLGLFVGAIKLNRSLQVISLGLGIWFLLLAASIFTKNIKLAQLAGYEGILIGAITIYLGLAELINEMYERKVLPV